MSSRFVKMVWLVGLVSALGVGNAAQAEFTPRYQDHEATCMGIWSGILAEDIGVGRIDGHEGILALQEKLHELRMFEMDEGRVSNDEGLRLSEVERQAFRAARGVVLMLDDDTRAAGARSVLNSMLESCADLPVLEELE